MAAVSERNTPERANRLLAHLNTFGYEITTTYGARVNICISKKLKLQIQTFTDNRAYIIYPAFICGYGGQNIYYEIPDEVFLNLDRNTLIELSAHVEYINETKRSMQKDLRELKNYLGKPFADMVIR